MQRLAGRRSCASPSWPRRASAQGARSTKRSVSPYLSRDLLPESCRYRIAAGRSRRPPPGSGSVSSVNCSGSSTGANERCGYLLRPELSLELGCVREWQVEPMTCTGARLTLLLAGHELPTLFRPRGKDPAQRGRRPLFRIEPSETRRDLTPSRGHTFRRRGRDAAS